VYVLTLTRPFSILWIFTAAVVRLAEVCCESVLLISAPFDVECSNLVSWSSLFVYYSQDEPLWVRYVLAFVILINVILGAHIFVNLIVAVSANALVSYKETHFGNI
jgi:hypothetical protein